MRRKYLYQTMGPHENMSWCKPVLFESGNKKVILIISEGESVGAAFWSGKRRVHPVMEGERFEDTFESATIKDLDDLGNPAVAKIAAFLRVESMYDAYQEELGCRSCPWRTVCDAMDVCNLN